MENRIIEWLLSDDVGSSSKSIVIHMFNSKSMKNSPPYDFDDRSRCVKLLKIIPEWVERLDEMKVYKGWEEQIPLIKKELLA